MAQKWQLHRNGDVSVGNFRFTGPFKEVHGCYETHVLGVTLPVLIATVAEEERKTDPNNPRLLAAEKAKINGNLTAAGQKRIKQYLRGELNGAENSQLAKGSKQLESSIELHGGQNESLWLCNKVVIEGNRRHAHLGDAVCVVYPNETTAEQIFSIVSQRHIAGPMEWASYAKAKEATRALTEFGWDMKKIVVNFQFQSEQAAMKYIHSYIWYEKSGLDDITQWSKFHHAYVPTLISHFGYSPELREFDPTQRRPANPKVPHPHEVDDIAGQVTDFNWLVGLIRDNKVTDCRHCDGIVAPAIREANTTYGEKVLEKLQRNPVVVTVRGGRGKPTKSVSPAQDAWNYLKESHQDNALAKKVKALEEELNAIGDSAAKRRPYQANSVDNHTLRSNLESLQVAVTKLHQYLPQYGTLGQARDVG